MLQPDVAELDRHRRAGMELQRHDAFAHRFLAFINRLGHQRVVDPVHHVVALSGNVHGVPFSLALQFFLQLSRIAKPLNLLLGLAVAQRGLGTAISEDAAAGFLAVVNAAETCASFEVTLIAFHHVIAHIFGTVLTTGVAGLREESIFKLQLEIRHGTTFPDDEGIALGGGFLGGLALNGAVLYGPEFLFAVPSLEGFAVEEGCEALLLGHSRQHKCRGEQSGDDFFHIRLVRFT